MERLLVEDIQIKFKSLHLRNKVSENGTYEIINASFIANEDVIFGKVNKEYVDRELVWYLSQSRNVNSIPGKVPKIWQQVSGTTGEINSNYGWCIFSHSNGYQYKKSIQRLFEDKNSRQSLMIYTRPEIHDEFQLFGMKDFICTNTVQLLIRNNKLYYIVSMRSNDAVFGYKNDKAWHGYVFDKALIDLRRNYPELKKGLMYWNATSLHVYARHFHLIENHRFEVSS